MAYGFVPVSHGGYQYNTGGFEEFPITDNYATSIFNGDLVLLHNDGVIQSYTTAKGPTPTVDGTAVTNPVLGVFVGCRYVSSSGTPTWGQYFPASAGTNAYGFVVTDYNAVFKTSYGAAWNKNLLGERTDIAVSAGSTGTGNSNNSAATTADNGGIRIVGVIRDGSNEGDEAGGGTATPDILVRWTEPGVTLWGSNLAV